MFKALTGNAPNYIMDMIELHIPQSRLRSAQKKYQLLQKCYKLETMGKRAFSVAGPLLWNNLPDNLRNITLTMEQFKKNLKTHLFVEYFEKNQSKRTEYIYM